MSNEIGTYCGECKCWDGKHDDDCSRHERAGERTMNNTMNRNELLALAKEAGFKTDGGFVESLYYHCDVTRELETFAALLSAQRSEVLEEAAAAVEAHDKAGREWVPGSLWDTLSREASGRIRALKTAAPQPSPEAAQTVDRDSESYRQGWMDGMKEATELCAQPEASSDKAVVTDEWILELAQPRNIGSKYIFCPEDLLYFVRALLQSAAPAQDAWHDAVLQQCMAVEGCYVPNDPTTTLNNLINWHVLNERDAAPAQTVAKPETLTEQEHIMLDQLIERLNERLNDALCSDDECKDITDAMQEEYSMMRKLARITSLSVSAQEGEKNA